MQNQDANQLPGADALPVGFIDSFVDFLAPATLTPNKRMTAVRMIHQKFVAQLSFKRRGVGHFYTRGNHLIFPFVEKDHYGVTGCLGAGSHLSCIEQIERRWATPDGVDSHSEALVTELGNSEREGFKKQMEKLKNQKDKLESLCRSLQAERKRSTHKNQTESLQRL